MNPYLNLASFQPRYKKVAQEVIALFFYIYFICMLYSLHADLIIIANN